MGILNDGFKVVVKKRQSGKNSNAKGGLKVGPNVQYRPKASSNTCKAIASSKGRK